MVTAKEQVWFRLDCCAEIGLGHLKRSLCLAHVFSKNDFDINFAIRPYSKSYCDYIVKLGYNLHVLPGSNFKPKRAENLEEHLTWLGKSSFCDVKEFLANKPSGILILDHYGADEHWFAAAEKYFSKTVILDDHSRWRHYDCDYIINPQMNKGDRSYDGKLCAKKTKIFGGTRNSLISSSWRAKAKVYKLNSSVKNVAFCPGGTDPFHTTEKFLIPLARQLPDLKFEIFFQPDDERERYLNKKLHGLKNCILRSNVGDLALPLANMDLAIGSAGSGAWERACLGIPQILLRTTVDQHVVARTFSERTQVKILDIDEANVENELALEVKKLINDLHARRMISVQSRRCSNGKGAENIVNEIIRNYKQ